MEEVFNNLIQAGPVGLVIIVVLIFLYFMEKRDKMNNAILTRVVDAIAGLQAQQAMMLAKANDRHSDVDDTIDDVRQALAKNDNALEKNNQVIERASKTIEESRTQPLSRRKESWG